MGQHLHFYYTFHEQVLGPEKTKKIEALLGFPPGGHICLGGPPSDPGIMPQAPTQARFLAFRET